MADIGIEHDDDFVRRLGHGFLQNAFDLFDFFHQVQLGGQASGGVGQYDVGFAGFSGLDGVVADGGGIAFGLGDDGDTVAFAPFLELLAGGGAEGVACGEDDGFALLLEVFGEFADGGGFARAVDAGHHDDEGLAVVGNFEWFFQRGEEVVEGFFERLTQLAAV